jgi:hypothetical protein
MCYLETCTAGRTELTLQTVDRSQCVSATFHHYQRLFLKLFDEPLTRRLLKVINPHTQSSLTELMDRSWQLKGKVVHETQGLSLLKIRLSKFGFSHDGGPNYPFIYVLLVSVFCPSTTARRCMHACLPFVFESKYKITKSLGGNRSTFYLLMCIQVMPCHYAMASVPRIGPFGILRPHSANLHP